MNLAIKNGAVTINGNDILTCINIDINSNSKIGIVGENGSGKTTLLKAIVNTDLLQEGTGDSKFQIIKTGVFKIGYLNQIILDEEKCVIDVLTEPFKELINIEKKLEKLNQNFSSSVSDEYDSLLTKYKNLGGYTYKKEYEVMLKKFGFAQDALQRKISTFSGGEKIKIAFMKLLLSKPDLLLLDEPTNNLDLNTILWLEDYLTKYKSALVLVSHDRMFLNKIVNTIYDIDYGELTCYSGNYDFFEKQKRQNYEKLKKDYCFQQKEIKRLNSIYERFRNKPSKASMALSKLKQIEKMDIIDKPNNINKQNLTIDYNNFSSTSKTVLTLDNLEVGYDHPLFKINTEINSKDKVAIIGDNGCGKSSLLKTITGELEPISGSISTCIQANPGYFNQSLTFKDDNNTILEEFRLHHSNLLEEEARSYLALFLFKGDDVYKKINVLSGGERARLKLSIIFANKPNILILDEVTNHIDIKTREYLEDILAKYDGTIIFISHDRYFVKKIASRVIYINENQVKLYDSYNDYTLSIQEKNEIKNIKISKYNIKPEKEEKKINSRDIKNKINKLENEISKLELKLSELKQSTFEEEIYSDYEKINKITKEIQEIEKVIEEKTKEWESLFLEK